MSSEEGQEMVALCEPGLPWSLYSLSCVLSCVCRPPHTCTVKEDVEGYVETLTETREAMIDSMVTQDEDDGHPVILEV